MHSQTNLPGSPVIRLAHAINWVVTWGMRAEDRRRFLVEGLADWEAMAGDHEPPHILWRALKGIPAAIWIRMSDRDVTAMPAGIALTLVGFGGIAAGIRSSAYPNPFRQYVVATSLGLLLVGVNFVRDPRRLVVRNYRLAGVLVAIGFIGLAFNLPVAAEWPYDGPVLENHLIDTAMQASFVMIAIAFILLVVASVVPVRRRVITAAGATLMVGVATLGLTQVSWGIGMAPIDLMMTAASVVIGLAALSFAHVLPRLRHLDFIRAKPDSDS